MDMETLGRSEYEGTYNDANKTSTVKSLSLTGGRKGQNYLENDNNS